MQKEIIITPANADLKLRAEALKIVNDFARMGFKNRAAFMAIVCHYYPKYKDNKQNTRLSNWWYGKFTDSEMASEIKNVINKLTYE